MPLLREKRPCQHCGTQVKEPKDPAYYLCPNCQQPGPWARPEQVQAWNSWRAEEDRKAAERRASEERQRQLEIERRQTALAQAGSLTPIQAPGFIAQKGESVYMVMRAYLFEW